MTYALSTEAARAVANTAPSQVWFFAMSSRRKDAVVIEAHILKLLADVASRRVGGCVRVGRIIAGRAETM